MSDNDDLDRDVDNIISQIKNQGKTLKKVEREKPNLQKEDLEKFVIDNASLIIDDSIEMIQALKIDVIAGADPKMVESISELLKATTSAIESLSKLKLSDDKIKAQKEIKQMDIDSKENGGNLEISGGQGGLYISREELLKKILNHSSDEKPKAIEDTPPIDI
tara:strand:+ start:54 stop:542 length:489 start_codon:yes stop_codon:yes gene_type:complete